MIKIPLALLAATVLAGTAVPAFAQSAPASAQAQTKLANDPNEIVCEKQEITGSRLSAKRICKTRAQWAEQRLQDRQEIEKVQVQRGMKGE